MTNEMSAPLALHSSRFSTGWWNCKDILDNPTGPQTPAVRDFNVKCGVLESAKVSAQAGVQIAKCRASITQITPPQRGVIDGVKVTPLSGDDWTPGPVASEVRPVMATRNMPPEL